MPPVSNNYNLGRRPIQAAAQEPIANGSPLNATFPPNTRLRIRAGSVRLRSHAGQ